MSFETYQMQDGYYIDGLGKIRLKKFIKRVALKPVRWAAKTALIKPGRAIGKPLGLVKKKKQTGLADYESQRPDSFNANVYLALNPDVAGDAYYGSHPYTHYVVYGENEGRTYPSTPTPAIVATAPPAPTIVPEQGYVTPLPPRERPTAPIMESPVPSERFERAGAEMYAAAPARETEPITTEMPPEQAFPEETARAAEEENEPTFAETTTSFYEPEQQTQTEEASLNREEMSDMAYSGLGYELTMPGFGVKPRGIAQTASDRSFQWSSLLTPIGKVAETAASLEMKRREQTIAQEQRKAEEARAQAAGYMARAEGFLGGNWPLILGIGGGILLVSMLIVRSRQKGK